MTARTAWPSRPATPRRALSRVDTIARIWVLREVGKSDHEIAGELELSVIYVRRILAAGRSST